MGRLSGALNRGRFRAVENSLHESLDVAFREDASQVRKDEGPANFA